MSTTYLLNVRLELSCIAVAKNILVHVRNVLWGAEHPDFRVIFP